VRDEEGEPVEGATVAIASTPLTPAVTDASGGFSFASVPEGTYDLIVNAGGCLEPLTQLLTVDSDENVPVTMASRTDEYGYTCRLTAFNYIPTDTPISLSGEGSTTSVTLPFTFMLYGRRYEKAIVSTAGYMSFSGPAAYWDNLPIPDPTEPNSALFGFWDDNYMDGASSAATAVVGTAPNRKFVMEWRNVAVDYDLSKRLTFEMVLSETGEVVFQYLSSDSTGAAASIGIENATGTIGHQYSYNQPAIKDGLALRYAIPHAGIVQGVVVDANDGLAVKNATVTAVDSSGRSRVTETDTQGRYAFQTREGAYSLSVAKKNYGGASAAAVIVENTTATRDFTLQTPRAEVSPTTVQLIVPVNSTRNRTIVLSNTGSLPMTFEITESGGSRQTTVSSAALIPLPSVEEQALTTKSIYDPSTPPIGWSPMDTGDVLFSFAPAGMSLPWGVGFTDNLWLSDAPMLRNSEFTAKGVATGSGWSTPWAGSFPADMAFVRARNRVCQLAVGGDNGIHCWDPTTGLVTDSIVGAFPWTMTSQRGLAYRADDDSFYVGGWNDGTIYHIQGLGGAVPGEVISSCRPTDPNISGLAYNGAVGVLWAATNSMTDTIYQLNAEDCTVLSTLAHPQSGGYQGGGLEMDNEGNLWMIGQSTRTAYLLDSGVPLFTDVPWLTASPATGTVAVGGKQSLSVTINTTGVEAGVYLASLFVLTDSGRQPRVRIPVSVIVSGYQQGINVGGSVFTDANGDPWAKDQVWSSGSWGYMQKGKLASTKKTIVGTTEQALFQSQRVDPYAYRFDDVPNGIYEVDLRFAELERINMAKRLYDVVVENTEVLPAHDIVYDVGQMTADVHKFFVEVTDNRMDVRFIAIAGYKPPVVNALRVTHRPDR
jgi:hypothetical protein